MLPHFLPLVRGERAGFEEDGVRDAHLADVVQERAAPDLHDLFGREAEVGAQGNRELCHAPGVPFRFPVSEVQGVGPAFNGRVVRQAEFQVAVLEFREGRLLPPMLASVTDWGDVVLQRNEVLLRAS